MNEFDFSGPDQRQWLARVGIDIDEAEAAAFNNVRAVRNVWPPPGPDNIIAGQGWCNYTTPASVKFLQGKLDELPAELYAYAEAHAAGPSSDIVLGNISYRLRHNYGVICADPELLSLNDIVFDSSYKLYLADYLRKYYPNTIVGTRLEVSWFMGSMANNPYAEMLYLPDTLDANASAQKGRDWGLKVRS